MIWWGCNGWGAEYMMVHVGHFAPLPSPAHFVPRTFLVCNSEFDNIKFILTSWRSYFQVSWNAPLRVGYHCMPWTLSRDSETSALTRMTQGRRQLSELYGLNGRPTEVKVAILVWISGFIFHLYGTVKPLNNKIFFDDFSCILEFINFLEKNYKFWWVILNLGFAKYVSSECFHHFMRLPYKTRPVNQSECCSLFDLIFYDCPYKALQFV